MTDGQTEAPVQQIGSHLSRNYKPENTNTSGYICGRTFLIIPMICWYLSVFIALV